MKDITITAKRIRIEFKWLLLSLALAFVLNELKSSALNPFIDDAIYNALCRKTLALNVPPAEKPKPFAFGIFRKKGK